MLNLEVVRDAQTVSGSRHSCVDSITKCSSIFFSISIFFFLSKDLLRKTCNREKVCRRDAVFNRKMEFGLFQRETERKNTQRIEIQHGDKKDIHAHAHNYGHTVLTVCIKK